MEPGARLKRSWPVLSEGSCPGDAGEAAALVLAAQKITTEVGCRLPLSGLRERFEGDLVSELLELADGASADAVLVVLA